MADQRITELTPITGAQLADNDPFVVVDRSDPTMAPSGTNKRLDYGELKSRFTLDGFLNGGGANTEVGVFNAAGELVGANNLKFTGTELDVTGTIAATGNIDTLAGFGASGPSIFAGTITHENSEFRTLNTVSGNSMGQIIAGSGATEQFQLAPSTAPANSLNYDFTTDQWRIGNDEIAVGSGFSWSTPVDANILPDGDQTRSIGASGNAFLDIHAAVFNGSLEGSGFEVNSGLLVDLRFAGTTDRTPGGYAVNDLPIWYSSADQRLSAIVGNANVERFAFLSDIPSGPFGDVFVSGTPTDNRVAVWTNANTIEGDGNFLWTGTDLDINGGLLMNGTFTLAGTPATGDTADELLVRDATGEVKQLPVSSLPGTIGGTIANQQIAYGSGADTITGSSVHTIIGSTMQISPGSLRVVGSNSFPLSLRGPSFLSNTVYAQFANNTGTQLGLVGMENGVWRAQNNVNDSALTFRDGATNLRFISGANDWAVYHEGNPPPSSGVAWGAITGTLSNQTDLQTALDAKPGITGTPANNEIAVWGGSNTIKRFSNFTFDGTQFRTPNNSYIFHLGLSTGGFMRLWNNSFPSFVLRNTSTGIGTVFGGFEDNAGNQIGRFGWYDSVDLIYGMYANTLDQGFGIDSAGGATSFRFRSGANDWAVYHEGNPPPGGGGNISGTIANQQIAFGTGADTIGGSGDLLWTGSLLQISQASQANIAVDSGFVTARQNGHAYRAIMGTSTTSNNFLFGGSTAASLNTLDVYLRVRTVSAGDLTFHESGNAWKVWHDGNGGSNRLFKTEVTTNLSIGSNNDLNNGGSGFWYASTSAPNRPPIGNSFILGADIGGGFAVQLGMRQNRIFYRGEESGTWGSWKEMYHEGSTNITAQQLTATNPNNAAASVALSWLNDAPRIRIGGSGAGASAAFTVQGTGDVVRMEVTTAGDVKATQNLYSNNGYLYLTTKRAIQGTDSYLRLNNNSDFGSGVYTPGNFRCDGALDIGSSGINEWSNTRLYLYVSSLEALKIRSSVSGNDGAYIRGTSQNGTNNWYFGRPSNTNSYTNWYSYLGNCQVRLNDAGNVAIITAGSTFTVGTTVSSTVNISAPNFVLSSDARLKMNIQDFGPKLIDIRFREFEMRDRPGEKRVGVVAQELAKRHAEFVDMTENGFLSVRYVDLIMAKLAEMEWRIKRMENSFVVSN